MLAGAFVLSLLNAPGLFGEADLVGEDIRMSTKVVSDTTQLGCDSFEFLDTNAEACSGVFLQSST